MKSKTSTNSNILDWSVLNDSQNAEEDTNGRPSIVVRQCVDDTIVDMLKNSDSTTWKCFDLLFAKIQEQSDHVNIIGDDVRLLTTKIENSMINDGSSVRSPLVESIFHDTLSDNINKILEEISNLNKKSKQKPILILDDVRTTNHTLNKSNAERLAGNFSTNKDNVGSQASAGTQHSTGNESNVDRLAGYSSLSVAGGIRSSTDLLNTTDVFTNSQLMNELTANIINDDSTGLNITAGRTLNKRCTSFGCS